MKSPVGPAERSPEHDRDQDESAFTPMLRRAWNSDPSVQCVVFVDREGESIDYVSSIEPFEAKVVGAHALMLLNTLRDTRERLAVGEPHTLEVACDRVTLWARRVSDDYAIVLLTDDDVDRPGIRQTIVDTCAAFRAEGGIDTPAWDQVTSEAPEAGLRVSVRPAVSWGYAPTMISREHEQVAITDVLGRWREDDVRPPRVCFRVRTDRGEELTLTHDPTTDGWTVVHP